ncbi:MAG: hypothetical protein JWR03_387 [Cohnella sp.]|nr:hypothetical protein [Cohnella sp.]
MAIVRRLPFLLLLTIALLTLSGCWSVVELNDRAFARILMLDKSDSGIEMTLGFPLPNRMASGQAGGGGSGGGGGSSPPPFTFVTKSGATIGDAYRQIQADMSRRITFGQLRHVVIGRPFAEAGLESFVDFVARVPHLHINSNLFVTQGKVKQFMQIPITFERFPTDILTRYVKDHVTVMATVKDLLMSIYHGGDFVAPMLVFGQQGVQQEKNAGNWMGTDGAALFKKGKMSGTLDAKETRGAMWILRDLKESEFDVPSPSDGKNISFIVERTKTAVKPRAAGDQMRLIIRCEGNARIIMTHSTIDLSDWNQLKRVERSLENELEERIGQAISKSNQAQTDAFQLGQYVEWRYPRQWKRIQGDWRERLANEVKVDPQVKIRVKWFGAVRKPEWNRLMPNTGESK